MIARDATKTGYSNVASLEVVRERSVIAFCWRWVRVRVRVRVREHIDWHD
jgi:hypothetical protein